jgi:hypothetical protein
MRRDSRGLQLSRGVLYASYLKQTEKQAAKRGQQLKVVKAMMPAPARFGAAPRAHLTTAVNGYMVLSGSVSLLDSSVLSILK